MTCWSLTAERQSRRVRSLAFHNIMRQHIGWFDVHQTGELNVRLSEWALYNMCFIPIHWRTRAGGGRRDILHLFGSISFIFMQFSGKSWSNNRLASPLLRFALHAWEILDAPLPFRSNFVSQSNLWFSYLYLWCYLLISSHIFSCIGNIFFAILCDVNLLQIWTTAALCIKIYKNSKHLDREGKFDLYCLKQN